MIYNPLQLAAQGEANEAKAIKAYEIYVDKLEELNNLSPNDLLRINSLGQVVGTSSYPTNTDFNTVGVQYASIQNQIAGTALSIDGIGAVNTGGVVNADETGAAALDLADASSFTCRWYVSANFTRCSWNPTFDCLFKTKSTIDLGSYFLGFISSTSVVSTGTLASGQKAAGLRFVIGTDSTNWQILTGEYTTVYTQSTGVAFAADTYYMVRLSLTETGLTVKIGSSAVSREAAVEAWQTATPIEVTSGIPSNTTGLLLTQSVYRGTGSVNRGVRFYGAYFIARFLNL